MEMPGALLIGDAAGTLDAARIKGIHQAMRSGMLAAEHLAAHASVKGFDAAWRASRAAARCRRCANIKPGFQTRAVWGLANAALETALGGHTPWTLQHVANDAPCAGSIKQARKGERPARRRARKLRSRMARSRRAIAPRGLPGLDRA